MKNQRKTLSAACLLLFLTLTSCMSTETLEPSSPAPKSRLVKLQVESPEDFATRASGDFKLRYIAKLYYGNMANDLKYQQRKELIEGTAGEGTVNQIIFDVPTGQQYTILVFADYIPASASPAAGQYSDYYYDTSSTGMSFKMLTTPASNSDAVDPGFFNNENYDCFSGGVSGDKPETEVVHKITLQRAVSKVRVIDTSGKSGNYSLSVSKLDVYPELMQTHITNNATSLKSFNTGNMSVYGSQSISPEGSQGAEILFYYTFATAGNINRKYANLTFKLSGDREKEYEVKNIPVQQNYITTIKGDFLSDVTGSGSQSGNGGGNNEGNGGNSGDDSNTKSGKVILNLATDEKWESTELSQNW